MTNSAHAERQRPFWRVLVGAVATLVVVGEMAIGGVWDLLRIPYTREVMTRLGYPTYVLLVLGALKVPAALVLMAPGLGRLKEWAYAGAFITYAVAASSHLAVGDELAVAAIPSALAVVTLVSWWLRCPAGAAADAASARAGHAVAYWSTTLALAAVCFVVGVLGLLHHQPLVGILERLGYPPYFQTLLGIALLAAGSSLLVPRTPRLKEWAYAGLAFNYLGAAASHLAVGDRVSSLVAPALLLAVTVASSSLRPAARRRVSVHWDSVEDPQFTSS